MGIFGLGEEDKKKTSQPAADNKDDKKTDNQPAANSQSDEAKEILKKMEAKKDAGDCAFC